MHEYFPYVALAVIVGTLWAFRRGNGVQAELHHLREEVSRALAENSRQNLEQVALLATQLNDRMKEANATLQHTQSNVGHRLDTTAQVVGQLHQKLGQLEESSKQIFQLGQGLQDLKDILKNPKLRGNMGEFFLEDLLRQILPPDHYKIQHAFRSGEIVDATIRLGEAFLSVDSKFPLESFVRLVQLPDGDENKKRERKAFVTAIKRHADAIAKKYILPDEGTFDFALMYIPAENVYYETIIREELLDDEGSLYSYLLGKKVVPVSPNSLYAYLQVIVLGLRGLKVQEHAQQMMLDLQRIEGDLGRFREDYSVLGKHLKNAGGTYDEGAKRLDRFQGKLGMLTEVGGVPKKEEIHGSL
ncbi:MAG: DNA recombination protein RmuC [Bacteriovoracia bacterium]